MREWDAHFDSLTPLETSFIAKMKFGMKFLLVSCFEEPHKMVASAEREGKKKKKINITNTHLGFSGFESGSCI
jgi:hypothetical protein